MVTLLRKFSALRTDRQHFNVIVEASKTKHVKDDRKVDPWLWKNGVQRCVKLLILQGYQKNGSVTLGQRFAKDGCCWLSLWIILEVFGRQFPNSDWFRFTKYNGVFWVKHGFIIVHKNRNNSSCNGQKFVIHLRRKWVRSWRPIFEIRMYLCWSPTLKR